MAGDLRHAVVDAWLDLPLFLPLPITLDEHLFIAAVFIGAMAVLFGIHPEVVLGITYFALIMYFVDVLGPHPLLAAMIIGTAAIARLAGVGGEKLRDSVTEASPETMAAVAGVLQPLISNRRGDREDE